MKKSKIKNPTPGAAMVKVFDALQVKDISTEILIYELKARGYRIQKPVTKYINI